MASPAQITANRRNAQASTGPRTPEGKSISSGNAVKHGLSAGFRVIPGENQDDLIDELRQTFQPTNAYEGILVEEMAHAHWRLARIRRIETAVIEQMAGPDDPAGTVSRVASRLLRNTADSLLVLHRHGVAAERSA
jgi:hypothetical protein